MSDHTYKFGVQMTCGGCSGAIDRVLKKLDGKLSCIPGFPIPHSPAPFALPLH